MELRIGDIVRFSAPEPGEDAIRFVVKEPRGDRALVGLLDSGMSIMPLSVYATADLEVVVPARIVHAAAAHPQG